MCVCVFHNETRHSKYLSTIRLLVEKTTTIFFAFLISVLMLKNDRTKFHVGRAGSMESRWFPSALWVGKRERKTEPSEAGGKCWGTGQFND